MKTPVKLHPVPPLTTAAAPISSPPPLTAMAPRSRATDRARTSDDPTQTDTLPELIACAISGNDNGEDLAVACLSALAEELDQIAYVGCDDVTDNAPVYFMPGRVSQLVYWASRRAEARAALVAHFEQLKRQGEK